MKSEFHPAAEQRLTAAVNLGEQRSAGLGGELLTEAGRIAELLCEAPNIGERSTLDIEGFRCVAFHLRSFIALRRRVARHRPLASPTKAWVLAWSGMTANNVELSC
jgi:hypothetical protein